MQNLNVKIENVDKELVIRTGAAEVIKDPKPVKFNGTFQAVINWWNKRKLDVARDVVKLSHIKYSKQEMKIELIVNEQKDYQDSLTGQIRETSDLSGFGINKDTKWTIEAFKKHIRLKKHLFHSQDEFNKLIKELTTYSTSVSTDINKDSDNRGNASVGVKREVKTNIPESFQLVLCPYKGYENVQFTVEIYIESEGNAVQLLLFSSALEGLLLKLQEKIFSETLEHFSEIPQMEQ